MLQVRGVVNASPAGERFDPVSVIRRQTLSDRTSPMSNALFVIVMFYCTSPDSCWSERPDSNRTYASRELCAAAIAVRGRDYLAPHFLKDETSLTLTCSDKNKPFSPVATQTAEFTE
jgi:hypothetical protein